MKIASNKKEKMGLRAGTNPAKNQTKKGMLVSLIVIITCGLIFWVWQVGRKAEQTVTVVMLAQNVYKNQVITEDLLKPYDILQGEFEKYALVSTGGTSKRRLLTWEERSLIINSFAAYPLQKDTYAEYRDFVKSRTDNSDSVLYSFPGKEIVPLEIGQNELSAFKTFLKPGDRLNIQAVFSEKINTFEDDGYGNKVKTQIEVFKTETVFGDIMMADLLNGSGESILDIYAGYNEMSVWDQARLDESESFRSKTDPRTLLVAFTPEEKERYYYYISKSNISFKVSMPQRIQ